MRMSRFYVLLLAGYVFLLLVIAGSADLGVGLWVFEVADTIPFGDKLGHLLLSGLLSFLLNSAVRCHTFPLLSFRVRTGSLVAFLVVSTEELSQFWIVTRNVDPRDLLCDLVGIYLFGVLATWHQRRAQT